MSQIPMGQVPGYDTRRGAEDPLVARYSSGWEGWITFAGVMMIILGVFNLMDGFVTLSSDEILNQNLLALNFTAWGWGLLVAGAIMVFAGIGILRAQTWARVVGVIVAGLNAVVQLAYANALPFWSILIIGIDVIVIYALTVHGRDVA